MKEYKVIVFEEKGLFAIISGRGKMDPVKFSEFLNFHANGGWRVVTIERELRRKYLLFQVEAMLIILEKNI